MKQVLIANRGEIALRIIKTLNNLGIGTVAIYHNDEKSALHVAEAQTAVNLGRGSIIDTYLNIPKIIQIAKDYNCDGIHPGYGFLSENYLFAEACEEHQIIFIGPSSEVIRSMGLKSEAKSIAQRAGVPVLESVLYEPGFIPEKHNFTFPLMIKAVAGGGGKGLKIAYNAKEFTNLVAKAQRESEQYFDNKQVMIEPYLDNARHIEVQILGDHQRNMIHLFERECSLQRNHQKIIEEAPAESISDNLRFKIHNAALSFARELNYTGAGTVEFLVSGEKFYFLEMNTRIQVEHPVTEMITNIDLVKEQIFIARGEKLSMKQSDVKITGHAIEARICAENPYENFRASAGRISFVRFPDNIRVDTFIHPEAIITPHFDSMLGKMVVSGKNRNQTIENLRHALKSTVIHGVDNNLYYLNQIVTDKKFYDNDISTRFLEENLKQHINDYKKNRSQVPDIIIAIAFVFNNFIKDPNLPENLWQQQYRNTLNRKIKVSVNGRIINVRIDALCNVFLDNRKVNYKVLSDSASILNIMVAQKQFEIIFSENKEKTYDNYEIDGIIYKVSSPLILRMSEEFIRKTQIKSNSMVNQIVSPLFGKIIDINVKEKERVKKGDILLTIESMKTENQIISPAEGIVKSVLVQKGVQVQENNELITLNPVK